MSISARKYFIVYSSYAAFCIIFLSVDGILNKKYQNIMIHHIGDHEHSIQITQKKIKSMALYVIRVDEVSLEIRSPTRDG